MFNKLASAHVMSAPWNRLLTYSRLQTYLLLIAASLSLGMICIGRQPVLVNDFRELLFDDGEDDNKETAVLREIAESFAGCLYTIGRIRTDSKDSATFFQNIGLTKEFGTRLIENGGLAISNDSLIGKCDRLAQRIHMHLLDAAWYRQLFFFRLGWSYIKGILLEEFEREELLQNTYTSKTCVPLKGTEKPGALDKKDLDDKMACVMGYLNDRLNDVAILDEYDISYRKIRDTHLHPSQEFTNSLCHFSNWISGGLPGNPIESLWLPGSMKWSEFDLDVLKKLLQDEINQMGARTSSAGWSLSLEKKDFRRFQKKQLENAGKKELSPLSVKINNLTEHNINIKLNLNKQEKLVFHAIYVVYSYIDM